MRHNCILQPLLCYSGRNPRLSRHTLTSICIYNKLNAVIYLLKDLLSTLICRGYGWTWDWKCKGESRKPRRFPLWRERGQSRNSILLFLRAIAECFARFCNRLGVCPSVCHTRKLYQNSASYDHKIFTMGCPKVSSLSWQNFVPLSAEVLLERGRRKGVPPKRTSFCRYWLE